REGAPSTGRWRSPVLSNGLRACLRECRGFPLERILRLGSKRIFPVACLSAPCEWCSCSAWHHPEVLSICGYVRILYGDANCVPDAGRQSEPGNSRPAIRIEARHERRTACALQRSVFTCSSTVPCEAKCSDSPQEHQNQDDHQDQ